MAYVKILTIRSNSHLGRATKYAMNAEKTSEHKDIAGVIDYISDGKKTWNERYVTGINCFPETAAEKMAATKKQLGKEGGRLGYQIIHSYAPGEVSAELAHKISIEYAESWLKDYEVVIGTHVDREHIHSHIVINSVSCVNGNKLHLKKSDFYEKVRGVSNEICARYGLSVIEQNIDLDNTPTKSKKDIILDIEYCIKRTKSLVYFYAEMEKLGYTVDISRKYATIKPETGTRNWRLDTLGFSEQILKRTIEGGHEYKVFRSCRRYEPKPLTRFQALYLYYMYLFGKKVSMRGRARVPQSEYIKFEKNKERLRFIITNNIRTKTDLLAVKTKYTKTLTELETQKAILLGFRKKYKRLFDSYDLYQRYAYLDIEIRRQQQAEIAKAVRYMDNYGYEGKYKHIDEKRIALLEACVKNRDRICGIKKQLDNVDNIIRDTQALQMYRESQENQVEHKMYCFEMER